MQFHETHLKSKRWLSRFEIWTSPGALSDFYLHIHEEKDHEPWVVEKPDLHGGWGSEAGGNQEEEDEGEGQIGGRDLHDEGRTQPVDLLETIVTVEHGQTPEKNMQHTNLLQGRESASNHVFGGM